MDGVRQIEFAAMIFENALDDGEAEPRPLLARGYIGLGQTVAVLVRQTNTVILDFNGVNPSFRCISTRI